MSHRDMKGMAFCFMYSIDRALQGTQNLPCSAMFKPTVSTVCVLKCSREHGWTCKNRAGLHHEFLNASIFILRQMDFSSGWGIQLKISKLVADIRYSPGFIREGRKGPCTRKGVLIILF